MTDSPPSEKYEAKVSTESVRATVKDGIPHYMGLTGDKLLRAVTITATLGKKIPFHTA